ncbi:MAG: hypothetical protein L6R40_008731 [Gallowayella cf. fulva]|nr:MAG: hypothetical protein L6R40_008731 [Xanthomendoza cf. fulva]
MPISKKDRVRFSSPVSSTTRREQKKADEAGTRIPKKANGNPVKAEVPKLKCEECFHLLDQKNVTVLEVHAATHAPKRTKEYCFPTAFKA